MSKYRVNRSKKVNKVNLFSVGTVIAVSTVVVIIAGALYLSRTQVVVVDNSKNLPGASKVLGTTTTNTVFDEKVFKISLGNDWERTDSNLGSNTGFVEYTTVPGKTTGRKLTIYYNWKQQIPVTKILPVTVTSDGLVSESVSPRCHTFTSTEEFDHNDILNSKWGEIKFMCNQSKIMNIIGLGTLENGTDLVYPKEYGGNKYKLVYIDHGPSQNISALYDIVKTFKAGSF